jgi:predicted CoA-binding protein
VTEKTLKTGEEIMAFKNPERDRIKLLLSEAKTIAVVGLSDNPARTSYAVSEEMQSLGYRILPVNPNAKEVLGEKSYPSLLDLNESVDIVNIFRRSEEVLPIVEQASQVKPRAIWMQLGVINEEAAKLAQQQGIEVIMDRCIKVEHALLIPHH